MSVPTHRERQFMQHLRGGGWVKASALAKGWIERRKPAGREPAGIASESIEKVSIVRRIRNPWAVLIRTLPVPVMEHRILTESPMSMESTSMALAGAAFHPEQICTGGAALMRPFLIPALAAGD
jgi:anthranilate/para-aminobenzoate synthase component II